MKLNPYYDAEKLGLSLMIFDEPDLSYEFNTLIFFVTPDKQVYVASDSGCSCPTPFEDYSVTDLDEFKKRMERVGSVDQGLNTFDNWNNFYSDKKLPRDERNELERWLRGNIPY